MTNSQNGWPVLPATSPLLYRWAIPARSGAFEITLRNGSAGFLLAHYALWFAETIQPVKGKTLDDWGWSPLRTVRAGEAISNHCSGTAIDLNALAHGLGRGGTFTAHQEELIHGRLRYMRGVIRWGGDYVHRKDEMHDEIVQGLPACEREAKRLIHTPRGVRIIRQNTMQRDVINS